MNFRKHELLDTQNLLFLIVFSILRKTPNATYIILFLLSIILSLFFNPAATLDKDIFMFIYVMLCVVSSPPHCHKLITVGYITHRHDHWKHKLHKVL